MKKATVNGIVTLHQHYLYWGYLQIAALDFTRSNAPALWYLHWSPTQPVATRPLSLRKNGTWYTYGYDLTKNVTELYKADGTIATTYDYTPYGTVTATGIDQPIQWSSEHCDPELALVYYNYRHYNPSDGRWINRDPIAEQDEFNLYGFVGNNCLLYTDDLGLAAAVIPRQCIKDYTMKTVYLYDCEQCFYICQCPPGYYGEFDVIKRPCTYPDVLEAGSCGRMPKKRSAKKSSKKTSSTQWKGSGKGKKILPTISEPDLKTQMEMDFRNGTTRAVGLGIGVGVLAVEAATIVAPMPKVPISTPIRIIKSIPESPCIPKLRYVTP